MASVGKDQPVKEDSLVLGGCRLYSDASSICGSVDLYSDLCGDELLCGRLDGRVANQKPGKLSEGQAKPFVKARARDLPMDCLASANIERTSIQPSFDEKPEVYRTKHSAMQKRIAILHLSEEETEKETNINGSSASEQQQVLASSEKHFDSIENEVGKAY